MILSHQCGHTTKFVGCLVLFCVFLTPLAAGSEKKPEGAANGRMLILDDFTEGLAAWDATGAADGSLQVVEDDLSGSPVVEWSLGEVEGKLTYRHMDMVQDFGRYNRIKLRVRAWDNEGRKGVGCAAKAGLRISGYPAHKVNRIPSWGLTVRWPEPSRKWRVINEYLDFPTWYPWGEKDNTEKGFWFTASAGFSDTATMRIDRVVLIDDVVEVHRNWGRLNRKGGSAQWKFQVKLINRTQSPQEVHLKKAERGLEKFKGHLSRNEMTVPAGETIHVEATVAMPQEAIEGSHSLYHEDLFVKVIPVSAPATATKIRLPATVPMEVENRPCLLMTAEEWKERRKQFQKLGEKKRRNRLSEANSWLDKEIVLPKPYPVTREVQRVNGTVKKLPEHAWSGGEKTKARWRKHQELFGAVETLGKAYQLTLDRDYAEKAAEIVKSYAENLERYPLRGITMGREKGWARFAINNLHEGWHIMPMAYGYDMIMDVPELLTPEEKEKISRDLLIPLARAETPIGSWFSNQTTVRYMAAALCGVNAGHSNFVHFAVCGHHGLQRGIRASINEDGFMTEIPVNYHWANLIEMLRLALVLKNTGLEVPYRRELLEKACRVPYLRAFPNGRVVGFGPHGYGRGPGYKAGNYETVARLFEDPVFETLSNPQEGRRLISRLGSVLFPHTELVVLRQGEGDNQHAVNFVFGNQRRCHDAATAFTWYGNGRLLAPAPGSLYNTTTPEGAWLSPFYCQVNVDDKHQVGATGELTYHEFGDGPQVASARVNKIFPGVKTERSLALHDGMLFVADRMSSDKAHAYQWAYLSEGEISTSGHFSGETITYRNGKMKLSGRRTDEAWHGVWKAEDGRLRVTMAGGENTQVLSGDSYISPAKEEYLRPIVLARRHTKETVFLAVLEPYKDKPGVQSVTRENLEAAPTEAAAIRVKTRDKTYVFVVNYSEGLVKGRDWQSEKRVDLIEVE